MNTFGCGIMLLYLKGLMYKMSKLFHARSLGRPCFSFSFKAATATIEHKPVKRVLKEILKARAASATSSFLITMTSTNSLRL
jgi:hypothetical protein